MGLLIALCEICWLGQFFFRAFCLSLRARLVRFFIFGLNRLWIFMPLAFQINFT